MTYIFKTFQILLICFISVVVQAQCPTLVWSDEFNGSGLDLTKWEPMIGDGCTYGICGWGNNELQYYKAENAVVSNGTLKIIVKKERVQSKAYTSARLRTKGLADFTFGRFEAKVKILEGQGLWPAFWMLSSNEPYGGWPQSGEIDIMELLGQEPEKIYGTIHYGEAYPNNQHKGTDFTLYDGTAFADQFNIFAIEWEPGEIRWYVNDILYQTLTSDDAQPYNWPFDASNQMHFLLNVAVGGNWPGSPDATTPFPNQMEVDWVRVYDNGFNPSISGDRLVPYQSSGEVYAINNAPGGASFSWNVPAGATITNGQNTSAITVDWGDTGGDVTCAVTTNCVSKTYNINVSVEANYAFDFSFENFDDPANITLNTTTGSLTEINNPDPSGNNTSALSAEYIRNSQEQYDVISYATSAISDASLYKNRTTKFYMDVHTSAPVGTEILIQLENSSTASASNYPSGRHSRYVGKITKNGEWERIVFDYLDAPDGSTPDNSVDQIIILFASNSFNGNTYYWDNFDSYATGNTGGTNAPPTASFTYSATDLSVSFDGSSSSDSDGTISNWSWDFGDGNNGSGESVSHTYTAAGDYTVVLTVTDNEGATGTDTQVISLTTGGGGDPASMHVQSIVTGSQSAAKGAKSGTATVTIHNDLEGVVSGATVTGTFSGTFNETVSGVTGADGTVVLTTSGTAKGSVTVNFCVDDVTHNSLPYNSSVNDITCAGSGARLSISGAGTIDKQLSIYPNPFSHSVNLEYSLGESSNIEVKVYTLTGKVVYILTDTKPAGSNKINIDLSEFEKGMYVIETVIDGDIQTNKILKTK